MSQTLDEVAIDQALKAKHRAVWASGDYPVVASDLIPTLGPRLVEASGLGAGNRVLDVAAGTGNASIPAALRGASVVASDLTPELLDRGREVAKEVGVDLEWRAADAEALPFENDEFDVVLSCVGVMFAPHHQPTAAELVRVCRPGGTIALLNWTPGGFIGQLFATMKPYAAPPPPGAQPPPLWGDEEHVRGLFGDQVTDFRAQRETLEVSIFDTPAECRDFFKRTYGPTIAAYRGIADDADRVAALDTAFEDLARRFGRGDGSAVMDWEYLLVTAHKAH